MVCTLGVQRSTVWRDVRGVFLNLRSCFLGRVTAWARNCVGRAQIGQTNQLSQEDVFRRDNRGRLTILFRRMFLEGIIGQTNHLGQEDFFRRDNRAD